MRDDDDTWTFDRRVAGWILDVDAPDWFDLDRDPRARRLKTARDRDVWLVEDPRGAIVAKVGRSGTTLSIMKTWLMGTPADREWCIARRAFESGIDTPRPLACGRRRRGRDLHSVLLSEYRTGTMSLDEAWRLAGQTPTSSVHRRRKMIQTAAEVLAKAHQCGLVHRDLHPRNLLVVPGTTPDEPRILLIDLHGARRRKSVTIRDIAANFAQLDQHFHRVATRCDRWRFVKAYQQARCGGANLNDSIPDPRELLRIIATHVVRHRRGLARQRDRRLHGDGRYFTKIRLSSGWIATVLLRDGRRHVLPRRVAVDMTPDQWRTILPDLVEETARAGSCGGEHDMQVRQFRTLPIAGVRKDGSGESASIRVEITSQAASSWVESIFWAMVGSPLMRAFRRCHYLRHRDHDEPPALAVVERRVYGCPTKLILIRAGMDPHDISKKDEQERNRAAEQTDTDAERCARPGGG